MLYTVQRRILTIFICIIISDSDVRFFFLHVHDAFCHRVIKRIWMNECFQKKPLNVCVCVYMCVNAFPSESLSCIERDNYYSLGFVWCIARFWPAEGRDGFVPWAWVIAWVFNATGRLAGCVLWWTRYFQGTPLHRSCWLLALHCRSKNRTPIIF